MHQYGIDSNESKCTDGFVWYTYTSPRQYISLELCLQVFIELEFKLIYRFSQIFFNLRIFQKIYRRGWIEIYITIILSYQRAIIIEQLRAIGFSFYWRYKTNACGLWTVDRTIPDPEGKWEIGPGVRAPVGFYNPLGMRDLGTQSIRIRSIIDASTPIMLHEGYQARNMASKTSTVSLV
jgi:hypothetical protein